MRDASRGARPEPACPMYARAVAWDANPARPFGSRRRQLIDRGWWLQESSRTPGEPGPPARVPPPDAVRAGA
jgi:endogenous inhibitor of DNA gyrase (YacG/DUF329 family)